MNENKQQSNFQFFTKSVKSEDSLTKMLQSELFDMKLAMQYLFNKKHEGIQCFLINRLYTMPLHEIEFYLPQLWYQ